jgi:hypothetical protein
MLTSGKNKRLDRIELTLVAWKATVLPLNYRRKIDSHTVTSKICFLQIFSYSKKTFKTSLLQQHVPILKLDENDFLKYFEF